MPQDKPMDGKNESPADPADEPEAIHLTERLRQIERRLKQARPRPPDLDAMALEQLAGSALPDHRCTEPAVRITARQRGRQGRRLSLSLVTVASAWACGALVGSLATTLLMGRIGVNDDPIRPVAQNEERLSPVAADRVPAPAVSPPVERGEPLPSRKPIEQDKESAVLATLVDPLDSDLPWRRIESSTLRAGMHFRKAARGASDLLPSTTATAKQAPPAEGSPQGRIWNGSEPAPSADREVTRERMLDDMLREMSGAVL
jgi:hypothetical protein